jgi:hypothetical protein
MSLLPSRRSERPSGGRQALITRSWRLLSTLRTTSIKGGTDQHPGVDDGQAGIIDPGQGYRSLQCRAGLVPPSAKNRIFLNRFMTYLLPDLARQQSNRHQKHAHE